MSLAGLKERAANAKSAKTSADHEFSDQGVVGWRFVERLEWNPRENHDETRDRVGMLRDKNGSGIVATTGVHLEQILVCHRIARAEARINLSLGVLELDNAGAT